MPPVSTLTLNPCVDKSTTVASLVPDKKLRCAAPTFEPGGGGINVARAIKKLNGDALAIYPAGGYSGQFLKELLSQEQVASYNINVAGHTRENFIVVDQSIGSQFRFGLPGTTLSETEVQQCIDAFFAHESEFLVVSGSLPPGVPANVVGTIANIANEKNRKLVADTGGDSLKYALEQGVFMIKPNMNELSELAGIQVTLENVASISFGLIKKIKCENLVVSLGAGGALWVSQHNMVQFTPPVVQVHSTVGAGDSMVAGIVKKLSEGVDMKDAIRYGVACGSAATMNFGTELCHLHDADILYSSVKDSSFFTTKHGAEKGS